MSLKLCNLLQAAAFNADLSDPYFSNVSLLLHGDGSDGSTTITDSSNEAHTCTVSGGTQIDTAIKKFGTGSIKFDGTGYVSIADDASFDMGSGSWTVEAWVYISAGTAGGGIISKHASSYSQAPFCLFLSGINNVMFRGKTVGTYHPIINGSTALSVDTWHHVAAVRDGARFTLFLDGTSEGYQSIGSDAMQDNNDNLAIGARSADGQALINGHIEEVRITKGIARYTGNFTPNRIRPFPDY